MNCTRRNFLIGGSTTLFLSGFFPKLSFASMQKKKPYNYFSTWRDGWFNSSTSNWR